MDHACRRFDGCVALVLGGGSDGPAADGDDIAIGNGRAIALRLASEGAYVVVADRDLASAQATVDACEGEASAVELDLADPESCRTAAERILADRGAVDAVVANAAISGHDGLRTQTIEEWDLSTSVNVTGHWLVAQALLPSMLERSSGSFVFVGSTASVRSSGRSLSYEATKAAQLAVMRHIAVRYARGGIRSNAVVLGVIDSPMVRREFTADPAAARARDSVCPMRRQGTPHEAAAAAAFLASDDASYVNGHSLIVDGGVMAAWPSPPPVIPTPESP
ncbi:MAG: SDR family oxidoreductase [Ilumatobacter fluminis]|uniref:SDR family NAD(P)-dependent oxidoreductase n=1 Tax=Ilumatobacter fluminis TaxID=467091 RepID=UPI0032EC2614